MITVISNGKIEKVDCKGFRKAIRELSMYDGDIVVKDNEAYIVKGFNVTNCGLKEQGKELYSLLTFKSVDELVIYCKAENEDFYFCSTSLQVENFVLDKLEEMC